MKKIIHTSQAPQAIGAYSQAVRAGNTVYISGQIPLDPLSMQLVEGGLQVETHQAFKNLQAIVEQAGGCLQDIVKLTIYLLSMDDFSTVNKVMETFFKKPYPARACVAVVQLPKCARVEVEAILVLND